MMRLADCFRYKRCQNFDPDDFLKVRNQKKKKKKLILLRYYFLKIRQMTDISSRIYMNGEGNNHNTF